MVESASWSYNSLIADKYLYSDGDVACEKPVAQTGMNVSFENGLYMGVWNSKPLEADDESFGNEQDFNIGLSKSFSNIDLDFGITYCDEPKMNDYGIDDLIYSYVKISRTVQGVTFFALFEQNDVMPNSSYCGGNFYRFGVSNKTNLSDDQFVLKHSLDYVFDTGNFSLNRGVFIEWKVELDSRLTKNLTLIVQMNYYVPCTVYDRRSLSRALAIGVSYEF